MHLPSRNLDKVFTIFQFAGASYCMDTSLWGSCDYGGSSESPPWIRLHCVFASIGHKKAPKKKHLSLTAAPSAWPKSQRVIEADMSFQKWSYVYNLCLAPETIRHLSGLAEKGRPVTCLQAISSCCHCVGCLTALWVWRRPASVTMLVFMSGYCHNRGRF